MTNLPPDLKEQFIKEFEPHIAFSIHSQMTLDNIADWWLNERSLLLKELQEEVEGIENTYTFADGERMTPEYGVFEEAKYDALEIIMRKEGE